MNIPEPTWRIGLVGPLPPPPGGIANQTRQLARLLQEDHLVVKLVQMNAPYHPGWIERIRGVRALFRLVPYVVSLWRLCDRISVMHVMANSGWSWHLFAAPAIWIGRIRGVPVVVNYRGGGAEAFFEQSWRWIRPTMSRASRIIVPSGFLRDVFGRFHAEAVVVPNVIDLSKFAPHRSYVPCTPGAGGGGPHLIVTRNLEDIYDNATAIRALALIREHHPEARMTIAGDGPERPALEALVQSLQLTPWVTFAGRLEVGLLPDLYRSADIMLNPSLIDNTPNSILEALASGVPVVSTHVGGVPYLVEDGSTALLVPPGEPRAMAEAVCRLMDSPGLVSRLRRNGLEAVGGFQWEQVRQVLYGVYREAMEP
ncbi:glycosyltransferase family 4 protein [Ectothiorhodospira shaposhnikovii]|uniref:glycosyltransferase family 4 protein n=1 Tax=Ectothiorhodospira shaposhnikovii TaxID=1054 RepID=UPI001EE7B43E|nr:glycosyltransferase family 4 protein [Ectothiorhodospira shaposhnikovii]MCG5512093.1 glycosyltransferase family 4 protein [Ectothiorhodospira shaposhnikovii]